MMMRLDTITTSRCRKTPSATPKWCVFRTDERSTVWGTLDVILSCQSLRFWWIVPGFNLIKPYGIPKWISQEKIRTQITAEQFRPEWQSSN